jgi:hypothetical protein
MREQFCTLAAGWPHWWQGAVFFSVFVFVFLRNIYTILVTLPKKPEYREGLIWSFGLNDRVLMLNIMLKYPDLRNSMVGGFGLIAFFFVLFVTAPKCFVRS